MIDFTNATFLKLGEWDIAGATAKVEPMLIDGETVFASFKTVRDQVIFTNKRVIAINVQGLTVEAALTGKREHIYHAAMMDPHTAAELDLEQIWNLVDDLTEAHGTWLPEWARGTRKQRVA